MFAPGDKLEYGHYTVLRELGAGGMGVVYHCRDEFLQREIAIKMLLPELMADDDTVEVFRQEARLAAQLEHPNVVTIHNIGIENKEGKVHHYIAMEFLPGGSLKQRIDRDEDIELETVLEWMKQLLVGLNYAHKRGVVHQDIKPDNIFITHDGNLKIGDFGLALIATGVAVERAVQGKGTPAYMSPELCRGDPQDHRSDIYSLGAVFFELLTREKPYKASGMIEMAMKHATAPVPSAKKLQPKIPDVLDKAIQKMMAKSADDRYQTLAEVLTIIEKLLLEVQVARLGMGTTISLESSAPAVEAAPVKEKEPAPPPIPNSQSYVDDFANFIADKDKQKESAKRAAELEASKKKKPAAKAAKEEAQKEQPKPEPKPEPAAPAKAAAAAEDALDAATAASMDPLDDLLDEFLADDDLFGDEGAPKGGADKNKEEQKAEPAKAEGKGDKKLTPEEAQKRIQEMDLEATLPPQQIHLPPHVEAAVKAAALEQEAKLKQANFKPDVTGEIDAILQSAVRAESAAQGNAAREAREAAEIGMTVPGDTTANPRVSRTGIPALQKSKELEVLWRFKTHGPIGWSSAPVLSKDRKSVYVASSDGSLYAFECTKGNVQWRYDTGAAVIASPVVSNDRVFIASTNGSLHAITPTGSKLWEYTSASPLVATPLLNGDDLLLSSMDGTLKYIHGKDGSVKWTYRTDGPIVSPPQVLEKLVFVASKDKSVHAVSLDKGWRQWVYATQAPLVCSPLVSTDSVYVGSTDGNLYALEAENGRLIWKYPTETPIVSRGTLEFTSVTVCSEDKWVHCIEKYQGHLLWKAKLHSPVMASLLSHAGSLYVANREGLLQCFELKKGELKWQMNCEKRLESTPLIAAKTLYQGMVNGEIVAYNLPT